MSEIQDSRYFEMEFADKSAWNEMKSDLKDIFKEIGIKYQYSGKTPLFHVIYESSKVKVEVSWAENSLFINMGSHDFLPPEDISKLSEIYDLLELFGGQLVSGLRPEEWK